jgi:hypothetical protein
MSQTDPRKRPPQSSGQPAAAGGVTIPGSVIRMQQPQPSNLPQQKPIDDDAIPEALPTPWWKKALKRMFLALLLIIALVFGYLFLLMGEPEEEQDAVAPRPVQPITIPMNALEAPGDAYLPSLAETFGQPVLGLRSAEITLQRARVYDTAFEGQYARRVTLSYLLPDGGEMLVESIRPIEAITLLEGDYLLQADRLYGMAGLDAARMQNDDQICVFGQGEGAVYAITMPRSAEDRLETLLKQTLLVSADPQQ